MNEVIPSFYETRTPGTDDTSYLGLFQNTTLHYGEVQELLYPDNPLNRSKKFIEYNVLVSNYENGTFNSVIYHNCMLINPLAGLADKLSFTLRADKTVSKPKNGFIPAGLGSKVLVLCLNGARDQGIILGGIRDDKDLTEKPDTAGEKGHNLHFNFNGIDFFINKDGEMTVQYQGKTDADAKINKDVDKNAVGTTLKIEKNGNFVVNTKDKKQSITIDHAKKQISIIADEAYTVNAKDVKIDASGSVAITDKNGTSIKGKGVKVGGASEAWMLGSTFRKEQAALHSKMRSAITKASFAVSSMPNGSGAASALAEIAAAISKFEAKSSKYLSKKNKTD